MAAVPGSAVYPRPELGSTKLRFACSKKLATLREAGGRLAQLTGAVPGGG